MQAAIPPRRIGSAPPHGLVAMLLGGAMLLAAGMAGPAARAGEPADAGTMGILWLPDAEDEAGPVEVVVALHEAGIDQRGWRYGEQLLAAGFAVLHLEIADYSSDGFAAQPGGSAMPVALGRLGKALDVVARDARFAQGRDGRFAQARDGRFAQARDGRLAPAPAGLLAFGEAGLAAMLAAADPGLGGRIGALALLYPGCAALAEALDAGGAAPRMPVLLLHGDADPANAPAACEGLAARLARAAPVRRWQYAGAGYAWDLPPHGEQERVKLPWPHRPGALVEAVSWPAAAEMSAAQVAGFFAATMPGGAR